jgi:hypothetical protein
LKAPAAGRSRYGQRDMAKTAVQRHQRVVDTQAWRARQKRGAAVYPIEVDGELFDLMKCFGGVKFEVQ